MVNLVVKYENRSGEKSVTTCKLDIEGKYLLVSSADYRIDLLHVESLDEDDGWEDDEVVALPPCTFSLRVYNHPIYENDLEFFWDGLWLTNLSENWKMHFGENGGELIRLSSDDGSFVH